MIKVVIDTDPGTDDALALMMALNSPELDVQGITTVGGNASLAHTTRNTLRLLEYLGHGDIPVSRGAARPLCGSFSYGYYYHGPTGLTARLPGPAHEPRPLRAADYILSLAYSFPGELVLIALGPLTNIARAISKEPRLKDWVKDLVVMGGAVEVPGNITAHAEFNTYNDPTATEVVLSSGIPVTLVGLDVTEQVSMTAEDAVELARGPGSEELAGRIVMGWFALHPERTRYNLSDPLAIVATLRPDLFSFKRATVRVETDDRQRLGKTTASYGAGPVRVAGAVRAPDAKSLIIAHLRGP